MVRKSVYQSGKRLPDWKQAVHYYWHFKNYFRAWKWKSSFICFHYGTVDILLTYIRLNLSFLHSWMWIKNKGLNIFDRNAFFNTWFCIHKDQLDLWWVIEKMYSYCWSKITILSDNVCPLYRISLMYVLHICILATV